MGGFYSDELPDFFSKPKNYHFKSKLNYYPITQAAFLGETEVVSNLIKLVWIWMLVGIWGVPHFMRP